MNCIIIFLLSWITVSSYCTISAKHNRIERAGKMVKIATFNDIKRATTDSNILIIDVREPNELKDTGIIPSSINIPLANISKALGTCTPNDFEQKYGHAQPKFEDAIIFTCRTGRRSKEAYLIAESLGYKNLKNFDGAFQNGVTVRMYSGDSKLATYKDILNAKGNALIIDVRETSELKETGNLPHSLNIPLGDIEAAFNCKPNEFKSKFGTIKPDLGMPIIFSCKAGVRSKKAMNVIEKMGYYNVKNYIGGWLDWQQRNPVSIPSNMSVATYEDVKNINSDTLLIDVREPLELQETGSIPKSINIPLGQLEDVFKNVPAEEFKEKFGLSKPNVNQHVIFSCKAGGRAQRAMQAIANLGYKNLSYYKGSWTEWAEKSNQ